MKKALSLLLCAVMLLACLPVIGFAAEETVKATNFVKEMVMNPIEAIKNVAQGNGAKLGTIIMIVIALIIT